MYPTAVKGVVDMVIYTVKPGDSAYSIAQKYGVSLTQLMQDNQLSNLLWLPVGLALVIMTEGVSRTVTAGESLYSISRDYEVTIDELLAANPEITDPNKIKAGQIIWIPFPDEDLGVMDVNGYALPSISTVSLDRTLPYLTYISNFSYQVRADGSLIPIEDDRIRQAARAQNVASMMVITNIKEGGSFDSEIAHSILTDQQIQDELLNNIITVLDEKNYFGLDIDFEYILPEDRDNYNEFLRKTVNTLHPLGYIVTTALAPKLSTGQEGLLYEAHDYAVHGQLADHVIIMTYEWGYLYGPAQAVAPIDQVERVLQYATSVIPGRKILMGMPNYGYDWTLPFVQGSAAQPLSNLGAIQLAARVGAEIQYDQRVQAPYFTYYDEDGREHIVWFDDARSIQARLRLVDKYNLGGVSYWTINNFFSQNWLVLNSMYDVRKVL